MSATGPGQTDVLIVSVEGTFGWRTSVSELAEAMSRAGARVRAVFAGPVRPVRTYMLTDLTEAWATRRAALRGIAEYEPTAVVYCAITAALLWPRPGAIWLDSVAAENRPGRHGVWQRVVERRRIGETPVLIGMSERALDPLRLRPLDAVLHVPVERSGTIDGPRDIAALTYAGDPVKRRLPLVLEAWEAARRPGEELVVVGLGSLPERRDGVTVTGRLARDDFRALMRRARVFVAAPLREDYGTTPLEALADGCQLVTTPAAGPYPAFSLARALDPRLVGDDLAAALRTALDDPVPGYAERAAEVLSPFSRAAADQVVKRDVLPRLLPGFVAS